MIPFTSVLDFMKACDATVSLEYDKSMDVYLFRVDFSNNNWHWVKQIFHYDRLNVSLETVELALINQCYIDYLRCYHEGV